LQDLEDRFSRTGYPMPGGPQNCSPRHSITLS
jgi:hypothetical protein